NARWIAIGLNVGTMFWSIRIRNSAAIQDSTMLAESNRIGHGYGLGNVRRAVEDHGGEFAYKLTDGVFSVEVNLPL
ncbi:MAG: ATP-binding protein, partial [Coriobacteriaceae bacterium]|nr:ATP-binding protein [Coriobacteriaceae bacterium]